MTVEQTDAALDWLDAYQREQDEAAERARRR